MRASASPRAPRRAPGLPRRRRAKAPPGRSRSPPGSVLVLAGSSCVPPLGVGSFLLLLVLVLVVLFLVVLFLVLGCRVAGTDEGRGGGRGFPRRGLGGAMAGFRAFARLHRHRVLAGEAAVHAGVIDVLQLVLVLSDQALAGEEEDVFAVG